jgi:hypothetical protein
MSCQQHSSRLTILIWEGATPAAIRTPGSPDMSSTRIWSRVPRHDQPIPQMRDRHRPAPSVPLPKTDRCGHNGTRRGPRAHGTREFELAWSYASAMASAVVIQSPRKRFWSLPYPTPIQSHRPKKDRDRESADEINYWMASRPKSTGQKRRTPTAATRRQARSPLVGTEARNASSTLAASSWAITVPDCGPPHRRAAPGRRIARGTRPHR